LNLRTLSFNLKKKGDCRSFEHGIHQASENHRSLIEPKKLLNPVRESKYHQEVHRELLFTQRRGLLPEHKPELQRVLEARRIKQLKQQEENQKPMTALEEVRKQQQKLNQYERELVLKGEQDGRPEFILVKESLKKIKLSTETGRQT
ncbi:protein FAM107B-like, partial [Rhineura floridana]|uniref:protein FAM107B-like n=1 Tax=Rhineura floridana TaxID=261503 RepID=UPI002AC87BDE